MGNGKAAGWVGNDIPENQKGRYQDLLMNQGYPVSCILRCRVSCAV